ncbi:uncharacterized protein LOC115216716 isoform X2 [Argonauta hians]
MTEVMASVENCKNYSLAENQNENFRTAEKNKGDTMRTLMDSYGDVDIMERPVPKLRGEEAQLNAVRSHGKLDMLFHNCGNGESNKEGPMRTLMDEYGEVHIIERRVPKLKGGEAKSYAAKNHGNLGMLFHSYDNNNNIKVMPPRYGHSGEENAKKNRGTEMGVLLRMEGEKEVANVKYSRLHQQSSNASWDEIPPSPRLRPEGELIVTRFKHCAMKEILGQNSNSNKKGIQQNYYQSSFNSYKKQSHHIDKNDHFQNGYTSGSPTTRSDSHLVEYHNKNKYSEAGAIIRGEPYLFLPRKELVTET